MTSLQSASGVWSPAVPHDAAKWFENINVPWWIAGGWALDLYLGEPTRAHGDLDVGILRKDAAVFLEAMRTWQVVESRAGMLMPLHPGETPRPEVNCLWCRPRSAQSWTLELLLDDGTEGHWIYRRQPNIRRSLTSAIRRTGDDIPYLAPEIQLLYKARHVRPKDQEDFERVSPRLNAETRGWLRRGLQVAEPGHDWIAALS